MERFSYTLQFEVCGHKYADLSEFGYGVAILSESKYGFSCLGNVLSISLLRSSTAPDAEQDQGMSAPMPVSCKTHYQQVNTSFHGPSCLIKVTSWNPTSLMQATCSIHPCSVCITALLSSFLSFSFVPAVRDTRGFSNQILDQVPFAVQGAPNVFLETIKRGEDDSKKTTTVILRLYEAFGGHANATLHIGAGIPVKKAVLTNMMEDEEGSTDLTISSTSLGASKLQLNFHRFEVKTVKLVIGKTGKVQS